MLNKKRKEEKKKNPKKVQQCSYARSSKYT